MVEDIEDFTGCNIGYVERTNLSFIDVPGQIATVVFVRGCSIRCPDCHNCELQSFDETRKTTVDEVVSKLNELELSQWICFQGGEPLDQADFVRAIIEKLKPSFKVCIYSGYNMELVKRKHKALLALPNVRMIKAGKFLLKKRIYDKFLATTNQRVILKHKVGSEETQWDELDWINNSKEFIEEQVNQSCYIEKINKEFVEEQINPSCNNETIVVQ